MGIIMWKKPKKVMTEEERREMGSSDLSGTIPGTYLSNMSDEDRHRWKGKVVGASKRVNHPQIEVRKYPFLMILSNGGYKHSHYTREKTKDYKFHLSTSGAIQMTQKEFDEFPKVIEEMKAKLYELTEGR